MREPLLASLCFTLFTSLALASKLIFATEPDGGLFRVFSSGISEYPNQNQDAHTFATQHTGGVGYDRDRDSTAPGRSLFSEESVKI